jgi:hypothetical protein
MEDGSVSYPDAGSPQGGVISPLLANVYLHYVLDTWFGQEVQPRLAGRAKLIRYADDFVIVFSNESDALRVMDVLPKRFGRYGLTLHPDKTRLVSFRHPDDRDSSSGRPGTFDLLGFTHYWGRSRHGEWVVKRKTSSSRLTRGLRAISEWCRKHRHLPASKQHKTLTAKIRGHYAYYGITGNSLSLSVFLMQVQRRWQYWLSRRNRERSMTWDHFKRLLRRYPLPAPVVVHSVYRTTRQSRDQKNRMR